MSFILKYYFLQFLSSELNFYNQMSSIEILLKAPVTEKAGNENKAFEIVHDLQHQFAF
jgi:hypothetical protein